MLIFAVDDVFHSSVDVPEDALYHFVGFICGVRLELCL